MLYSYYVLWSLNGCSCHNAERQRTHLQQSLKVENERKGSPLSSKHLKKELYPSRPYTTVRDREATIHRSERGRAVSLKDEGSLKTTSVINFLLKNLQEITQQRTFPTRKFSRLTRASGTVNKNLRAIVEK